MFVFLCGESEFGGNDVRVLKRAVCSFVGLE